MKRVLWISRHEMTQPQRGDLERVMGGPVCLLPWRDTVRDVAELAPVLQKADVVAAVLPPELLSGLLDAADGKPVLRAIARREPTGWLRTLPDGRSEPEFAFVHDGWEQVLRIEIRTRRC